MVIFNMRGPNPLVHRNDPLVFDGTALIDEFCFEFYMFALVEHDVKKGSGVIHLKLY
jgi:hypothetical protein